jgi:L-glyceraldehyde 3-phosphate reductase
MRAKLNRLNDMASARGQSLAQMALAWVLRDERVTTALIGASKPEQVADCVGALRRLEFDAMELTEIDEIAQDAGLNLWARSSEEV